MNVDILPTSTSPQRARRPFAGLPRRLATIALRQRRRRGLGPALNTPTGLRRQAIALLMAAVVFLFGCRDEHGAEYAPRFTDRPPRESPDYLFGVHPLHNPERLFAVYQPLVDYFNRHLDGARLVLEASRNYAAYDEKLFGGRFHLALPNPYQTVTALGKGYRVFGKMGDDENFRGIILVRKDGGIREPADLMGRAVSYPAPTALAATMLPQ